jgi:hypothetical protein
MIQIEMINHIFKWMQISSSLKWRTMTIIASLFKEASSLVKIDLREVIILDSQSTMDLFCNKAFSRKTCKSTTSMRLKINGGTMVVTQKATIPVYNKYVWFSTRSITNIHRVEKFDSAV